MEGEHNQLDPNIYTHTDVADPPDDTNAIYLPTPNNTHPSGSPLPTLLPGPQCDKIAIKYEIAPATICAVCFVFGVLYCFFGELLERKRECVQLMGWERVVEFAYTKINIFKEMGGEG